MTVIEDTVAPVKPDAVFPNNWISFHADGTVVTYPMYAPLRRQERREDVIENLADRFSILEKIELERHEQENVFLEGTGSMVLDRANRIAYACISQRTDPALLEKWCARMQYRPFTFHARYAGQDIYHTNVMMAIGEGIAVVALEVVEPSRQQALRDQLLTTGHEVVELTADQVGSFAGNMLALKNQRGEQLMVMSRSAYDSLTPVQRERIGRYARLLHSDVTTIETIGGGSVRCMIAENFLPVA